MFKNDFFALLLLNDLFSCMQYQLKIHEYYDAKCGVH